MNYFPKILCIIILLLSFTLGCSKKNKNKSSTRDLSGIITDQRDGTTYQWVRLKDGKMWMKENLDYASEDSWCYDEQENNCQKVGRLYSWQAAQNACPEGWRIPSDQEWWEMSSYYGKAWNAKSLGVGYEVNTKFKAGETAYKNLLKKEGQNFSASFGGARWYFDSSFRFMGEKSAYWSSTTYSSSDAWHYRFMKQTERMERRQSDRKTGYSCRCISESKSQTEAREIYKIIFLLEILSWK